MGKLDSYHQNIQDIYHQKISYRHIPSKDSKLLIFTTPLASVASFNFFGTSNIYQVPILPLSLKCMPSILNAPVRRNRATGNVHLLYERSGDGCLPCPPLGYALPVAGGASSMWSLRRVGDTPIERPILPHPPPDLRCLQVLL